MPNKKENKLKCSNCSALLKFDPSTSNLICEYCGSENHIIKENTKIKENNYNEFLDKINDFEIPSLHVKCNVCAAEFTLNENISSDTCPFCTASIIMTNKIEHRTIKPAYLLPFKISSEKAKEHFIKWTKSLFFAPNDLKIKAQKDTHFKGVYIPFWTYDTTTFSKYEGQRGTDYYTTEHYTAYENGKAVTRTRTVKKTRWKDVSGSILKNFDDVLVCASKSLKRKFIEALEPWDFRNLTEYKDEYLSGFTTELYQISLKDGFIIGREIINREINDAICNQIGGDHQIVNTVDTDYNNIKFKHILLPVWISTYKYNKKTYNFLVNARNGEVQGESPISWIKVSLLVLFIILCVLLYILFTFYPDCNFDINCTYKIIFG